MELWKIGLGMALNFVAATGIIFLNRFIFIANFNYVVTLTIFHYATTWAGIYFCVWWGVVTPKPRPLKTFLLFAMAFGIGVPLCNASLKTNTVGTYQIMKALITPFSVAVERFYYQKHFSKEVLLSLVPVCFGVAVTGLTDISLTALGLFFGLGCVVISVLTQIWAQRKQKEFDWNAMQLMYHTIPWSNLALLLLVPATDDLTSEHSLFNYDFTPSVLLLLALSGLFAGVINITIYVILKETSPVTYQIYGHLKTITILVGSFLLFGQPLDGRNVLGMAITLSGAFLYTYFKLKEQGALPSSLSLSSLSSQPTSPAVPLQKVVVVPSSHHTNNKQHA